MSNYDVACRAFERIYQRRARLLDGTLDDSLDDLTGGSAAWKKMSEDERVMVDSYARSYWNSLLALGYPMGKPK